MLSDIIKTQVSNKPKLHIEELILDSWRGSELSKVDKSLLESFSQLQFLSFSGCGLTSLTHFPKLPRLLNLVQSPVSQCQLFRARIFSLLPELEVLDKMNQEGEPTSMSEEEEEESEEEFSDFSVETRENRDLEDEGGEKRGRELEYIWIEDSDEESPEKLSEPTKKQKKT